MNDVRDVTFDLTPPTEDQLASLKAELSDEERHVLLQHGTEAPFCGVFLTEKRTGYTPAGCAGCRCSTGAPSSRAGPGGRASRARLPPITSMSSVT